MSTARFVQSELVEVKRAGKKGRGVFARQYIDKGTVIERVPVIVLRLRELCTEAASSRLAEYVFTWGKDSVAVALGYGSMYNHSYRPNAEYDYRSNNVQVFTAVRNIKSGEEITVNYNGSPTGRGSVGFDVVRS